MRSLFVLSLLLSLVLADLPGDGAYWWTISTKNATLKNPDNLFLSSAGNGKIYATRNGQTTWFQTTPYNETKTISFHPGPLSYQLALQIQRGEKGLMTLVEIYGKSEYEGPTAESYPKDLPTEWSVFQIGKGYRGGPLLVEDGQDIPTRQWITYRDETDTGTYVGLWDGVTPQSRQFNNITLIVTNM